MKRFRARNDRRAKYESHTGGIEHASGGVDLFVEVLGLDEGMLATPAGDDGIDMGAIVGKYPADMVGIDHEDATAVVEFFGILSMADLLGEQGGTGPKGASEEAGGVGGGSHRNELTLVEGGGNVLGFIDDEEQGGGGADDVGFGVTGEEGNARLTDQAHEVAMLAPATGSEGVAGEDLIEAEQGVEGLGFVGGVDGNHAERKFFVEVKKVSHELDEEFVLAGLAGEDDDEGVTV